MQREITERQDLLDSNGHVITPGFAKQLLWNYDRKKIKAGSMRIKEWDYYLIHNDRYGIAFTIADNSYLGFISVTMLDFERRTYETFSEMKFFTKGKLNLPSSSQKGDIVFENKKIKLEFLNDGKTRKINCIIPKFKKGKSLSAMFEIIEQSDESMVIATPFKEKKTAFYYNQKINCMRANGSIRYGKHEIEFNNANAVLDWGRGVWTYDNTWFWGTGSGKVNGVSFGFNIGYGFGDTTDATENMVFYNGEAHKLDQVTFEIPKHNNSYAYMKEWKFTSNDKRFEMTFSPILDRKDKINLLFLVSDQHQVFGKVNGFVVLDNGNRVELKDFMCSAEVVHNRW